MRSNSIITHIDQNVKAFSRQMGGYIRAEKAAMVYGGLAYLGLRMISRISPRKNFSLEKSLPDLFQNDITKEYK